MTLTDVLVEKKNLCSATLLYSRRPAGGHPCDPVRPPSPWPGLSHPHGIYHAGAVVGRPVRHRVQLFFPRPEAEQSGGRRHADLFSGRHHPSTPDCCGPDTDLPAGLVHPGPAFGLWSVTCHGLLWWPQHGHRRWHHLRGKWLYGKRH